MGLKESNVTKNISKDAMLWRYMTLDKLINILSTNQLYFSPLHSYEKTDPFEGIPPKVSLEAMREISSSQQDNLYILAASNFRDDLIQKRTGQPAELEQIKYLDEAITKMSNIPLVREKIFFRAFKSTLVNCWHQNEFESEAMWRLYSENNKGIAIQTTLQDLINSIDDERVHISEVKYIDFQDKNLKPKDCVVNGHLSALLKRKSFEHEKEVRLFFQPENDLNTLLAEDYKYQYQLIDINLSKLISKVYISPYASELFASSVKEVFRRFGLDDRKLIHSDLLKMDNSLISAY